MKRKLYEAPEAEALLFAAEMNFCQTGFTGTGEDYEPGQGEEDF